MDRILKQALDITTTQQDKCVAVGLSSLEGGYKPCDGVYRTAILCKQFSNSSKGVQDKFEDGLMKAQNCPKLSANRLPTLVCRYTGCILGRRRNWIAYRGTVVVKQNSKIANDAYWVKWRGLAGRAGRHRVQLVRRSCSGDSTAGEKRQARVRLARSASKWGPNRVVTGDGAPRHG